ncbi:hypothetical protein B0G76_1687 [Paraburkholderia sp. BL23I1N1]|nr:hypothetical protein B0G71_1615 [Paraburkholderia sp. BL27I4N3]RKE35579.1 hypothetical protein B0G76_1687 [Paraburkholderia sp. BL23I1N1]
MLHGTDRFIVECSVIAADFNMAAVIERGGNIN